MKKLLLSLCMLVMSICASAQDIQVNATFKISNKNNTDVEAIKEKVKAEVDKQKDLNAFTKVLAKKMAGSIVKKQMKQIEEMRWINGYPDGDYTVYYKEDGKGNSEVNFCPALGRIIINDFSQKKTTIAFPTYKIALVYEISFEGMKQAGQKDATGKLTAQPIPEGVETTNINGFDAMENLAYKEVEEGTEPTRVIIVDGKKMEAFPLPGHVLMKDSKNYYPDFYVEAETDTPYLYSKTELTEFKETNINDANFNLPSDYTVYDYDNVKKFNKTLQKLIAETPIQMKDPGTNTDIYWP